eukprot:CAMPEP_0202969356 /NCGR_PEP_ID=MMETSP1396-20130829/15043_1 /ASSEMBLY_ACC=CAM_ASM_000872 /TAXON_ID= /ORGANISM="Pseudokeronopsis sp., Strain Brazil" /LENGTH=127 /DNA_ID=CAMNT_0049696781 /DNA_START=47 /DNA_END=430 /DNA_ORIENTATION=+
MIKKGSEDWALLLERLKCSRLKSNRDVLCVKCWQILTYQQYVYHRIFIKEHSGSILTSRDFASEAKFMEVSRLHGKVEEADGEELYKNPYLKKKYYLDKSLKKYVIEDIEDDQQDDQSCEEGKKEMQ